MPRLTGRLIREARRISPLLPGLLPVNRTIERALLELKWIKNELPENEWKQAVRQRSRFVPLQYILKSQPFGELNILCKKGVLIPRWETEEWCLRLTEHLNSSGLKNLSILDVCTGSGCIPLLMSHELSGTNANIYAFDVSEQAVSLANENLSSYKLKYNTQINLNIYQADVFDPEVIKNIKLPKLDLVTSNPPYIPQSDYIKPVSHNGVEKSVRMYEPSLALIGDTEFYHALLDNIVRKSQAEAFIFELGYIEQADYVYEQLQNDKSWTIGYMNDSADRIRCVLGWKKGSKFDDFEKLCNYIY